MGRFAAFLPAIVVGADLALSNGPSEATGKPIDRAQEALNPDTRNETIAFLSHHLRRKPGSPWRDRIEVAGVGFDWQNAAEAHGFDQTLGYNPLRTALVTRALGAGGARLEDLDELLLLILNGAPFGEERTVGRLASLSGSQVRSTEVIIGFNPD